MKKFIPVFVVDSKPDYQPNLPPWHKRIGCNACCMHTAPSGCTVYRDAPNEPSLRCLSTKAQPSGGHYKNSQHKISVSRNKREGKMILSADTRDQTLRIRWGKLLDAVQYNG